MNAAATKLRVAKNEKAAAPVTLHDVLFTIVFFGLIAYLTLLFIVTMA